MIFFEQFELNLPFKRGMLGYDAKTEVRVAFYDFICY